MSEENVPRLRLKPKLAADPAAPATTPAGETPAAPATPAASPAATPESLVPPATPEAPKFVRLKPRLSATPPPEPVVGAVPAEVPPSPEYVAPTAPATSAPEASPAPAAAPAPAASSGSGDKPVTKFSFRPKAAATPNPPPARPLSTPPIVPEPGPKVEPLTMRVPASPATAEVDTGENGEPAEITAIRAASSSPFPAPTGKFPPPVNGGLSTGKPKTGGSSVKKLAIYGVLAVVVLGGGFYGYTVFMAEPPTPPPKPKLAANPTTPQGQAVAKAQSLVEKANEQASAAVNEIMPDAPAATTPAAPAGATPTSAQIAAAPVTAAPVVPAPPPAATVQFKAWVENLRISGVRGGASTKVFIGGTAYGVGDLVNPQLGIVFEGYNPETRLLTFKDKSGATVERRN